MRFLLIVCGAPEPELAAVHGTFVDWFQRGFPDDIEWRVHDAREAEPPTSLLDGQDALVITGSAHSVYEPLSWIRALESFVRAAVREARMPTLGVCFGHQLLAQSLGGEVVKNPRGREIGTVSIAVGDRSDAHPMFASLPESFRAQATHSDTVVRAPAGARVRARSELDDCQAFEVESAVGVQFHPEFRLEHLRALIRSRRDVLLAEGLDPDALERSLEEAPHSASLLRTFADHVRRSS